MTVLNMDCVEGMRLFPDAYFDSIVTDPPYELGFMGKHWDGTGIAYSVEMWREALRVLKPGGHLLAFSGSRTYHRMVCAIEDAGFEIRDQIMWVYGSGFPKSLDVSKAIDKHGGQSVAWFGPWLRAWREANGVTQKEVAALFPSKSGGLTGCVANWELGLNMPTPHQFNAIRERFSLPFESLEVLAREIVGQRTTGIGTGGGTVAIMGDGSRDITAPATDAARQWAGWGTALKPAHEPIVVARKPLVGTVAANVLQFGTGALNIDRCRVESADKPTPFGNPTQAEGWRLNKRETDWQPSDIGRWPANLIHDGSDEVLAAFPQAPGQLAKASEADTPRNGQHVYGTMARGSDPPEPRADLDKSAARFFYCAKASRKDRNEGCDALEARPLNWSSGTQNPGSFQSEGTDKTSRNNHPTVKPTDLMRYLCRLVTPPGGTVLDPFTGSGSTGKAAKLEGFGFIGIEKELPHVEIALARIAHAA